MKSLMILSSRLTASALILSVLPVGAARIDSASLDQKIAAVLPTAEEDAFLRIPWRFNLLKARAESARTGKPLFIWSMNGHPLGHT